MPLVQPNNVQPRDAILPYLPEISTYSGQTNFFQSVYPLQFTILSDAQAATPAGEYYEINVLGRNYHAIQVSGTFNASVLVEGTLDGQNWAPIETITSAKISQYTGLYQSIRVSIPSYTSGTINVSAMTMRT